ncbi:MAG: 8-oxo-dGTP diphosphatase [Lachnospiraceae bacterium]|nr:8-oxo-dGTP diphosphatase [Lachnospiraceae bacterium]
MKKTTLCYIKKDNRILLLHRIRKLNDPNEGKWIGIGGHFESGETPEQCLLREVREETNLTLTSYHYIGIITFESDTYDTEEMHLFTADAFEGEVDYNCDEGELAWMDIEQVSSLPMWEGDREFLPYVLEEPSEFIRMTLRYEGDNLVEVIR